MKSLQTLTFFQNPLQSTMTSNVAIEEGSCTIVIFFLLLPVMICIIKDVIRDFKAYSNHNFSSSQNSYTPSSNNIDDQTNAYELKSLLKSKDSDDENASGDDDDDDVMIETNTQILNKASITSVTLIDSEHRVLAQTPNLTASQTDNLQLCTNSKIPKLILSPIMPVYDQCINVPIKPMELMLWLLFLTFCYIALRTMVLQRNLRYNFKYLAVEMQDIFELCLRGIIMYIFGNIQQRVCPKFFLWIGWFVLFFPFNYQICPTSFTIDIEAPLDNTLISICIFVGVSNVYIVLDNFWTVWNMQKWWIYGYVSFFSMVVYHFIVIKSANSEVDINIHHHHWAFVLSLFLHSKKESSAVMHALLTAVFIHGITVFGCENLFEYKSLEKAEVIDV